MPCSEEEPEKGGEKEKQVIRLGSGRIESQIRVLEVTTTKAGKSGRVVKKNEEAPMSCSEEEPEERGGKENQVISLVSGKMESQIRVPEMPTIKADKSGPVMSRKEEAQMSFSEEEPKKGGEKEKPATSSGCEK